MCAVHVYLYIHGEEKERERERGRVEAFVVFTQINSQLWLGTRKKNKASQKPGTCNHPKQILVP